MQRSEQPTCIRPTLVGRSSRSISRSRPPSWLWAGPAWAEQVHTSVVTGLAGITLAASEPDVMLARWSEVLNIEASVDSLTLPDASTVRVVSADHGRAGIVGIDLWAADGVAPRTFEAAGVRFGIVAR